jgi:acetyltransferase-like isoleucine patch superfamily enzyme
VVSDKVESNCCEIEALVATVSGINPDAVVAFSGDILMPGSEITVVAEVAGKRAGEASDAAIAIRRLVRKRIGITLGRVYLVRPGWVGCTENKAQKRADAANKIASTLHRRQQERLIRVGNHQENIDEAGLELFGSFGASSRIMTPVEIHGPSNIHIGSWVVLGRYGKILILDNFTQHPSRITQHYPDVSFNPQAVSFTRRTPTIVIKDGANLGDSFFFAATCRIEIGQHVLASSRLFLSDCGHVFDDPRLPITLQGNTEGTPLIIEDGCFFGINVSVIKGVRIGKHSVIGTNSVVNKDIPPFAVVGGNPAKVIRLQDPELSQPSSMQNRSFNQDTVIQTVRNLMESNVGHVLDLDLDLRNDGILTKTAEEAMLAQIPIYFSISSPILKEMLGVSRTLRDLGRRLYECDARQCTTI